MPKFASTNKSLLTNKDKLFELAKVPLNENCLAMLLKKLPEKLGDSGKFLIPCDFPRMDVCHALADLGTSINLTPLSIWKKLSLPELTPTRMTLELADRSITRPKGVAEDVFVKVEKFHFPTNFVVVNFKADSRVLLILGRSFLKTGRALIDSYGEEITLRVNDESVTFNLNQTMRYSLTYDDNSVNRVDVIDIACEEFVKNVLDFQYNSKSSNPTLVSHLSISGNDFCKEPIVKSSSPTLTPFRERDILYLEKLLNEDPFQLLPMDLKLAEETKAKSSVEEPPELELKELMSHLQYAFLEESNKLPVIIAKDLKDVEKEALIKVLKSRKRAIAWKISDIKGYFQIPIDPQDQEKTTFTCPYGTFAYRCMPFGLCNAPGTFQREGIVLGHKILRSGIEVDRAKVDVIAKLPHPTTVKGVRSFLGHAGFYRRFIQHFSKIARPMTYLLEKETPFVFSKECINAFDILKKKLTEASILVVPDWNLPFELMCDASDFTIGAVLGQRKKKHFQPIHYASKTMTEAQIHYTTTEKEMLAIVYPRLLRRVLLLQEFDITILDKKGSENLAADHLSRLENPHKDVLENKEIKENFPLETIEVSNRRLKRILERTVGENRASWSDKLDDALWAFRTAFKTPIGCTPYKLVYGKSCLLPIELEHRAYWALKHVNFDLKTAGDHRKLQLNELNELRDQAYENSVIYKERTKKLHNSKIKNRIFNVGDQVLLFNSRLKIFSGKLKTSWSGPFTITQVFP
nr:reverse transcriptase domain-containing protein [Tanacetum cinerariifolium]